MRYFKAKIDWNYDPKTQSWVKADRIYKRDVTGKMWTWYKEKDSSSWVKLRFNEASKVYKIAKEISEKEAFIEIL